MLGEQPNSASCPECGEQMKLVATIPSLGALPALFWFYCARCHQAKTLPTPHKDGPQ